VRKPTADEEAQGAKLVFVQGSLSG
jgi:hypothetical protein